MIAKRGFDSYQEFDNLKFWAKLKVQPANGDFPESNKIETILVPGDVGYGKPNGGGGGGGALTMPEPKDLQKELDDQIPFISVTEFCEL